MIEKCLWDVLHEDEGMEARYMFLQINSNNQVTYIENFLFGGRFESKAFTEV